MAFDQFTQHRVEKIIDDFIQARRPPPALRNQVDLGFKVEDQSIVIYERRSHWKNEGQFIESLVAKATYVRKQDAWKIYWLRQDLKWHSYESLPEVNKIEDFLAELALDPNGCFWK
jgi:hypothetical protein